MDVTVLYDKEKGTIISIESVIEGTVINYNPLFMGVIVGDSDLIRESIKGMDTEHFDSEIQRIQKSGEVPREQREVSAKAILDAAYSKIAAIIDQPVDKAHDFVKEDLVEKGKVEPKDEEIEIPIDIKK